MSKLTEGAKAPDFTLPATNGRTISLKDYRGKKNVVLYFYPKDDTSGCTLEACNFRDAIRNIEGTDSIVLGVSPDSVASHEKFTQKLNLPFLLLSDPEKKMLSNYGVWVEKSMYGRKYMGIERTTFIIDKEGKIAKTFRKVQPKNHHEEVMECLNNILSVDQ